MQHPTRVPQLKGRKQLPAQPQINSIPSACLPNIEKLYEIPIFLNKTFLPYSRRVDKSKPSFPHLHVIGNSYLAKQPNIALPSIGRYFSGNIIIDQPLCVRPALGAFLRKAMGFLLSSLKKAILGRAGLLPKGSGINNPTVIFTYYHSRGGAYSANMEINQFYCHFSFFQLFFKPPRVHFKVK